MSDEGQAKHSHWKSKTIVDTKGFRMGLEYRPLASLKGSELRARTLKVVDTGSMGIQNQGPMLADHRIYFGSKQPFAPKTVTWNQSSLS